MDDIDRQLLILFQKEIPLNPRPFEVLKRGIGIHSADVLLRLNRLQEDQRVGRITALFDPLKMGYQSHLAALRIPEEFLDQAAYHLSGHPGVTQCIKRKGSFNLWFSLTLPVEESLEFHFGRLKELSKATTLLIFKTEKIYKPLKKIKSTALQSETTSEALRKNLEELTLLEKKLIRFMQEDFPLVDDPYARIAKEIGSSEELVLKQLQFFQKKGLLKKIAVLPAVKAKKSSGALLLWDIPREKIAKAAAMILEIPEISFCAQRTPSEDMPYNLHALVDDVEGEKVVAWVDEIERRIGMWPRQILFNEKEEKCGKFKFFSKDIEEWRVQHEVSTPAFFSV